MMIYLQATTRRTPPASDWRVQPPALVSVQVDEDENVEWQWTHFADGRSVVTGYRIVPRLKHKLLTV